ncbi:MAG TPA: DUF2231 domain-containing protein [Candidatus Limnocylindrales bacterium]|nr:DUF2231 domain-containing protein [Candidatus Limnocylindrales bacterium]
MESRLKLLGHPIHPMLIVFPLGLLATAVIFDILYVVTGNADLATFSYYAMIAGVVGGLLAAVFGLLDWTKIPKDTRARRIGAIHGGGNVVVTGLFLLSLASRWGDPDYLPSTLPMIIGLLGAVLALFTAWLGGELVYRLRVAVDDDANLNASNSISREGIAEVRT